MRKLWLVGIAAVLVLVLGPMLVVYAADKGAPPRSERKADGMKGGAQEVILTPAQEDALGAEVMDLCEALGKLQAKAETVLKDRDHARRFVMQILVKEMRAAGPEAAKNEARKNEVRGKKANREK